LSFAAQFQSLGGVSAEQVSRRRLAGQKPSSFTCPRRPNGPSCSLVAGTRAPVVVSCSHVSPERVPRAASLLDRSVPLKQLGRGRRSSRVLPPRVTFGGLPVVRVSPACFSTLRWNSLPFGTDTSCKARRS